MAPLYQVFLSHNGADTSELEMLASKLQAAGIKLFFDHWDLVPGEPWQEALEKALSQSGTCAVFISRKGLGPWQNLEMRSALERRSHDRSFRVIPVLLPGAKKSQGKKLLSFLDLFTWVDFHKGIGDDEAFRRLVHGIQGTPPRPGGAGAPVPAPSSKKKWLRRFWLPLVLLVLALPGWLAVRAWLARHSHVLLLVPSSGVFDRLPAVNDPPPGPHDLTCSLHVQLGDKSYIIHDLRRQPIYLGEQDELRSVVPRIAGPEWVEKVEAWSKRLLTAKEKRVLALLSSERPLLLNTARLHIGEGGLELTCTEEGRSVIEESLGHFTIARGYEVQPVFLANSATMGTQNEIP